MNPCYNPIAGQVDIQNVNLDKYGNPQGNEYDLGKDGAFAGHTIAVLHLYTMENFDFKFPEKDLQTKGFRIVRWTTLPSIPEFQKALSKASQLWVIADHVTNLPTAYLESIEYFFNEGHGLMVWGDNDPYNLAATQVLKHLFPGVSMAGNYIGSQVMGSISGGKGFLPHLVTTGLNKLFEGVTIASLETKDKSLWTPVLRSSDGNLAISAYDSRGCRCLVDGGFTKLYINWDSAGTGRYVTNAAVWLCNLERFGEGVDGGDAQSPPRSPPRGGGGSGCGVAGCSNPKCTKHFCKKCHMCPSDHLAANCPGERKKCRAVGCVTEGCLHHVCRACGDTDSDHRAINCPKKSPQHPQKRGREGN